MALTAAIKMLLMIIKELAKGDCMMSSVCHTFFKLTVKHSEF